MKPGWSLSPLVLIACGANPSPVAAPPPPEAPTVADAGPAPDFDASTPTPTPTPTSDDSPNDAAGVAYLESVQVLYKAQRDPLTKACWLHAKSTEHAYAGKAIIRVGPGGKVVSTKTDGTDDPTSACIDKQIKKWKLPPPNGTATVTLPIRLHRD